MSNLSDLLPAGAAAKQLTFTDSGSGIASKAPCVLESAGTVSPISITAGSLNSAVTVESAAIRSVGEIYVPILITSGSHSGKVVYMYNDNSPALRYSVISYSGSTPSATTPGSPGWADPSGFVKGFWDESEERIVVFVGQGTGGASPSYMWYYHNTFSGTDTLGTPTVGYALGGQTSNGGEMDITPIGNSKYVVCSGDASTYNLMQVWSLSGGTLTVGSDIAGPSHEGVMRVSSAKDGEFMYILASNNSSRVIFNGCTVSGTTITKGTDTEITSGGQGFYATMLDSGYRRGFASNWLNKHIAFYNKPGDDQECDCRIIEQSGTSLTLNTINSVDTSEVDLGYGGAGERYPNLVWGADSNTVVIFYPNRATTQGQLRYAEFSISGNTITTGTSAAVLTTSNIASTAVGGVNNQGTSFLTVCYGDYNDNNYVKTRTYASSATNLTAANFVGVADSAISASAAGSVIVQGGTVSEITDPFGTVSLTLASPDTTSGNGQKENVSMAYDSNADRTILVYRDGGDSDKLKCIIGTLSGTSTSWGTPVEIVGATAGNTGTAVVYDSNAQRVLIAYTKASDTYAYVRVGEISGTSVTLGTEVAASSSSAYYSELSYDVADQKVLLVFANAGDNYYPYSAACTITAVGNSVAVTTPALVSSRNAYDPFGLAYNVNDGKHVLDITDNTSTGYAYVLTMSSGSISVGAEATYSPGFTPRQSICVYDSSAQKIVRAYYSNSSPYPVSAAVASISGTNVTFGTAATAFTTNSGTRFHGTFDSSLNQVGLVSRTDSTNYIETNFGSVSGTTITFGTATSVYSGGIASTNYNIVYDSTAQKLIYAYAGATYDAVVGTLAATTFTTGTKYYVTSTGGFSSSAGDPSVSAGLAISGTSLLLNGDS